jgi:hypothetical protein
MGKIAHCLPVVVRPRFPGSTAAPPEALSQVQVAVNDVARSVVGCRREDHVAIVDLLEAARSSRSATPGEVRVRTRGLDTHVTHELKVWNACRELRDSRTKAEACRAATGLARDSPL